MQSGRGAVIKPGGQLFATEGLRGLKKLLLQGGRGWLLQILQLSQRKALCNLHQEVCMEGRGRGQEEAAALRRGQSKLLSRKEKKKKSQTKTPDATVSNPPLGPRPPCPSRLLSHAPQPRASLGLKVPANRVRTPRDAQPMGPLDPPRPRRAQEGLYA